MSDVRVDPNIDDELHVVVEDGIMTITFNRPHRLNAMTPDMGAGYLAALNEAGSDSNVGVVVVTGAGRAFCAGADLESLEGLDAAGLAEREAAQVVPFDIAMSIPKPVIAAINGPVAGIGLAHALMADLRFAAADAKFITAFSKLGLVAEGGLSWLLPRLVGTARSLDLLWSSRPCMADEALRIGLVQWVVPADELMPLVMAYARDLISNASPHSIARMKQQVHADWSSSWAEALARSMELLNESLDRPEFAERLAARSTTRR